MRRFLLLVIGLIFGCTSRSLQLSEDEIQIRTARDVSNLAIEKHDTVSLASTLTSDYHVVTSRNAEVSGRHAMLDRFAGEFASKSDIIYIRTPEKISVFDQWSMASETGNWVGRWTENGEHIELSGTYFAKWHKVNGHWKIRAEVFVPLSCAGGKICDQSPI